VRTTSSAKNLAIKNNGCKLENFGCDMQVLNIKLIQTGGVFKEYKPNKVAVMEQLNRLRKGN